MQKTNVVQGCDLYLPVMNIHVWGKIPLNPTQRSSNLKKKN
jgi:hypothetical protein